MHVFNVFAFRCVGCKHRKQPGVATCRVFFIINIWYSYPIAALAFLYIDAFAAFAFVRGFRVSIAGQFVLVLRYPKSRFEGLLGKTSKYTRSELKTGFGNLVLKIAFSNLITKLVHLVKFLFTSKFMNVTYLMFML